MLLTVLRASLDMLVVHSLVVVLVREQRIVDLTTCVQRGTLTHLTVRKPLVHLGTYHCALGAGVVSPTVDVVVVTTTLALEGRA